MDKKISIIVPVYNVEKYLDECLKSILSQTYDNFEVILVNDGSTDESQKIIDDFVKKDVRIKSFYIENSGLSFARNLGISKSCGDFLFFLDSDDCNQNNTLEEMIKLQNNSKESITVCNFNRFVNDYDFIDVKKNNIKIYDAKSFFKEVLLLKKSFYACGVLFPKEIIGVDVFPLNMYFEDLSSMYLIYSKCKFINFVDAGLYKYRINPNSIVHTINQKKINDYKLAVTNMISFSKEKYLFSDEIINVFLCESFIECYIFSLDDDYIEKYKTCFKNACIIKCNLKYMIKLFLFNYSKKFRNYLINK